MLNKAEACNKICGELKTHQMFSTMAGLGQISSRRFATSATFGSNRNTFETVKFGTTEQSALIINSYNGYPNNMRRTSIEEHFNPAMAKSSPIDGNLLNCCPIGRTVSECHSEDSFIVFEACDTSDLDCDFAETESDSGDDNFSDDDDNGSLQLNGVDTKIGTNSKNINIKMVHFASDKFLTTVHRMIAWKFAYQESRKGHWEEYARDRERFQRRIDSYRETLERILDKSHREHIFQERFAHRNANGSEHNFVDKKKALRKRKRFRKNGKKKRKKRHKYRRKR